jgi:hypothetical protein
VQVASNSDQNRREMLNRALVYTLVCSMRANVVVDPPSHKWTYETPDYQRVCANNESTRVLRIVPFFVKCP